MRPSWARPFEPEPDHTGGGRCRLISFSWAFADAILISPQVKEDFFMKIPLKVLVEGALCVALSIALSFVKLFALPQGGSVTLSMLPLSSSSWR